MQGRNAAVWTPEQLRLWDVVTKNRQDYASWIALISAVEASRAVSILLFILNLLLVPQHVFNIGIQSVHRIRCILLHVVVFIYFLWYIMVHFCFQRNSICSVYQRFLAVYPLCVEHRKKYADYLMSCNLDREAFKVYEDVPRLTRYAVDFWLNYCSFALSAGKGYKYIHK